jgi:hypothetical protein
MAVAPILDSIVRDLSAQLAYDCALPPGPTSPGKEREFFTQYRLCYLRYHALYVRLEAVYQSLTHPLLRMELGALLDLIISRMVLCRGLAARWHPVPPDVADFRKTQSKPHKPLAWECVEWDDLVGAPSSSSSSSSSSGEGGGGGGGGGGAGVESHLLEATALPPPAFFKDALRLPPPPPRPLPPPQGFWRTRWRCAPPETPW